MSQVPMQQALQPDPNQQLIAAQQQQIALMQQQLAARAPAAPMAAPLSPAPQQAWGAQPAAIPPGTLIPFKLAVGPGTVKVLIPYGPEFSDPNALGAVLNGIIAMLNAVGGAGLPVDVYVPKQNNWGGGNGGGYNNGGGGGYGGRRRW